LALPVSGPRFGLVGDDQEPGMPAEEANQLALKTRSDQIGADAFVRSAATVPARAAPASRTSGPRTSSVSTSGRAGLELNAQGAWRLSDAAFVGLTILVVDDDSRNTFAMTALLERGRADVLTAASGPEGIAILNQRTVDIVLMDIMMPGMDGYETMRTLREFDKFKALPIIAVTGKVMPGERERCLAAGASDYVPKPVDTFELVEALRSWLP
jgi:CheY-like chemotaxis protein